MNACIHSFISDGAGGSKNAQSLVMKLSRKTKTANSKSMLFMGDYEGPNAFRELLDSDNKQQTKFKADVWALPHHGATLKLQDNNLYGELSKKGKMWKSN